MGTVAQCFGLSSAAFPGHKQEAGWEAGQPGLELVPMWDPSTFKAKTLTVRLLYWALRFIYFYGKVQFTERRRDRDKDLPLADSLPK